MFNPGLAIGQTLKNSEIVSRVHMYVTVDKEKHMHV